MTSQIPTLDIRRFTTPANDADRGAFVAELGAAYREWGFAGIRGHGIPQSTIDGGYDVFQRFFALPEDVKCRYRVAGSGGARGYTPFGVETAKGAQYSDLKEFWHIGREIPRDSKYAEVMQPNLWPDEVPRFRQVEYAGVLKGAKNPEGMQKFIDFMLGREFQAALPDNMYVFPVDDRATLPTDWASVLIAFILLTFSFPVSRGAQSPSEIFTDIYQPGGYHLAAFWG